MKADLLREKFLTFFKSKKHRIIESDSLVPKSDPTVLFTPAGMNQFKNEFLGAVTDFRRAATAQRCLRTDDLDKVGHTSGHHTFFEMLGNFSFGDYFKEEAIAWAWEFLTEVLKIKEDNLWVSVYEDDAQAHTIWKEKIKVPVQKIVRLTDKENFWPSQAKTKGPNGPCGPCSEIFFDLGQKAGCGRDDCNPGCNCGRFIEVWNLVFTQFNRKESGILEPLPQKNIDTGMGLERLAAVMQGKPNNFETDLFKPLIQEIAPYVKNEDKGLIYAVADHARAIVFAIYDGVLPSNEGRGYVIRKLIRKSSLHLRNTGIKKPFLYRLAPVVAEIMNNPYPELKSRRENISEIVLAEEKAFISILESSEDLFKDKFKEILKNPEAEKAAKAAFYLYDTYGIPFELSREWLGRQGVKISEEAFNKELGGQKARSKLQSSMKGDVFDVKKLELGMKETVFSGYNDCQSKSRILKILKDNSEVKEIGQGEEARVILDKTPFYPASGGQVGDSGELLKGKNAFEVLDTHRFDKVIVHIGRIKEGKFKQQDRVLSKVDFERRLAIARNHTATHLLQAALRKVLGHHVKQQGSLVAQDRLRFDFSHFKDLSPEELDGVEDTVNYYVLNNYSLNTKQMPLKQARKSGALAFFGEKYEGKVRVVAISDVSKELCGGTHLESTGQIGLFKIIQEGSVASGVRRIEAVTGAVAYRLVKEEEKIISDISAAVGAPKERLIPEIEKRLARIKEVEKQLAAKRLQTVKDSIDDVIREAVDINGIKFISKDYPHADMNLLRRTADLISGKTTNAFIVLTTTTGLQISLVAVATPDLCVKGVDVSGMIKEVAPEIGGSGGGRKDFAQAGGNRPANRENVIRRLRDIISQIKI